jgi:hypothetical protein
MLKIDVKIKHVYGTKRIYVIDPELKKAITQITRGKETLNNEDIESLKTLGIEIACVEIDGQAIVETKL